MITRLLDWLAERQHRTTGTADLISRVREREDREAAVLDRQRNALDTLDVTYRDINRAAFGREPWPRGEARNVRR